MRAWLARNTNEISYAGCGLPFAIACLMYLVSQVQTPVQATKRVKVASADPGSHIYEQPNV